MCLVYLEADVILRKKQEQAWRFKKKIIKTITSPMEMQTKWETTGDHCKIKDVEKLQKIFMVVKQCGLRRLVLNNRLEASVHIVSSFCAM